MGTFKLSFEASEIDEKLKTCVENVEINLADYGVDVLALFVNGGGTVTMNNATQLFDFVNNHKNASITFVINGSAGLKTLTLKTVATKTFTDGNISGLTATIPVYYEQYTVAYLWVTLNGTVKLSVQVIT